MTIGDIDPRLGPRAKLERAKIHLAEFNRLTKAYAASDPYNFVRHIDPDGTHHLVLESHQPIPIDWCPIIGDIVHNCRSALDFLISLSAGLEASTSENFRFPIFRHRADFEARGLDKLRKYGCLKTISFVQRLKPYERGRDLGNPSNTLVLLNRLSVRDKHRMIIPVGTAAGSAVVTPKPVFGEPFKLAPPDNTFLEDGEIIISISPKEPNFAGKDVNTQITFQIRLGGIEPIPPIGAPSYLSHIVKIVGRIVNIGERRLLGMC